LHAVPASRLLLLTSPDAGRVEALRRYFGRAGIAAERIELVSRIPLVEYLRLYARIDIALDTWPYTGGTTTCDALWMGTPVVSLASDRPFARSGASILAQLGLADLVASTRAHYVSIAGALATDRQRLGRLRAELRPRMAASALTDAAGFARDFEAALRGMWDARAAADVSEGAM
jgi:predicted O-linked N-acetylglucosamine transferase (SPINDLY family)